MNVYLIIAGILSLLAALLHLLIIYNGTRWYQFFHAGDWLVNLSRQKSMIPVIITFLISVMLFIWAMYAFSGAQLIQPLPYLKPGLIVITTIYILRGLAIIPLSFFYPQKTDRFMFWSSIISLIFGLFYFIGFNRI